MFEKVVKGLEDSSIVWNKSPIEVYESQKLT